MQAGELEAFFAPVLAVRTRRMFGGIGIYDGDAMFGLSAAGRVYLKTDDVTRPLFAEAGSEPFRITMRGAVRETSYWSFPESAQDDTEARAKWVSLAREASERAAVRKFKPRGSPSPRHPR
ncbi:TfoX/Sxy family protein [Bosea beijingensis]|uniref:TfoX/Sxy family protein n=1 Tax=Bosea beijingensis TaxID=3068632 RepID=UPI002740DFFF|nr:TfoX/Sxy family protein [Bosea sp. REN20]